MKDRETLKLSSIAMCSQSRSVYFFNLLLYFEVPELDRHHIKDEQ